MDEGRKLLESQFDEDQISVQTDSNNQRSDDCADSVDYGQGIQPTAVCKYRDFIQVIESLLSFHAWYKSDKPIPWDANARSTIHSSIKEMLKMVKRVLPRSDGHSWNLQKFHELLHVPHDVENFGSPKNFDTGIMENRLIHVGKHNSKNTQKRGPAIFTQQLGLRIAEQQAFQKTKRCLNIVDHNTKDVDSSDDDSETSELTEARQFRDEKQQTKTSKVLPCYQLTLHNGRLLVRWCTKTKRDISVVILSGLRKVMTTNRLSTLDVFTEIKHDGMLYRAHPNYRGGGPWYDWAAVQFVPSDVDKQRNISDRRDLVLPAYPVGIYPCKMLAFFYIGNVLWFLSHPTMEKISSDEDSCLTERWNLQYVPKRYKHDGKYILVQAPDITLYEVQSIVDRIYVVEEDPGIHAELGYKSSIHAELEYRSSLVLLVKKREMWPKYFTDTNS
jgi:hypothetical protein